ncbi:MAG: pyridoxal phosphate-dependent aminotransferase [Pseudomonadota bacterium]
MIFSRRLPAQFEANPFTQSIEEIRRSGRSFLDLTVSNPTETGLEYPTREIRAALASDPFPYAPHPRGDRSAREAVSALGGKSGRIIDPANVWLTSGTSEGYAYLAKLLADPGQEIAIPTPSYPLFSHLFALEGVTAVPYPLRYAEGWMIDWEGLERSVSERTRGIVVVNPNNPTGHFTPRAEVDRLLSFCERRGIALIADEVFFEFPLADRERVSFARPDSPALTFVLDGLSKIVGLPQCKLSWISAHGPASAVSEAADRLDWISDQYLSVGTAIQRALPALTGAAAAVTPTIRKRVAANNDRLREILNPTDWFRLPVVEGGWSAIVRLPDSVDEEQWVEALLRDRAVLVYPGYFFDLPFRSSLVVSLLPEPETFREGVTRIGAARDGW